MEERDTPLSLLIDNEIEIWGLDPMIYEKIRIGYVPRELNLIISRLMDAGKAFFCRIEDVELV